MLEAQRKDWQAGPSAFFLEAFHSNLQVLQHTYSTFGHLKPAPSEGRCRHCSQHITGGLSSVAIAALVAVAPSSVVTVVPLQFTFSPSRAELFKSTSGPSVVQSLPATKPHLRKLHPMFICPATFFVLWHGDVRYQVYESCCTSGLGSLVLASHVTGVVEILLPYPSLTPLFPSVSFCPGSISGFGLPSYSSPIFFHFPSEVLFPLII